MKKQIKSLILAAIFLSLPGFVRPTLAAPMDPTDNIDDRDFNDLNPLRLATTDVTVAQRLSTPGGIISRFLSFAFPIAGFILFIMIVWGGFEMILGATSKKMDAGRQRVTAAVIGFFLLFASFWIIRVVDEALFGGTLSIFQ